MRGLLTVVQVVAAVFSVILILLQQKGSGLGSAFGGESYLYQTRRGAEKVIFGATVVSVALFLIVSFAVTQLF